jgi:hypothetical protein
LSTISSLTQFLKNDITDPHTIFFSKKKIKPKGI